MENVYTVIKVERCLNSHISAVQSGDTVKLYASLFENCIIQVPGTLKLSESTEDGERLHKSELTFNTKVELKHERNKKRYAYRITISDGRQYLMGVGCRSHPEPTTTMSRTMGSLTSSQVPQYKVTLQDVNPLPIII